MRAGFAAQRTVADAALTRADSTVLTAVRAALRAVLDRCQAAVHGQALTAAGPVDPHAFDQIPAWWAEAVDEQVLPALDAVLRTSARRLVVRGEKIPGTFELGQPAVEAYMAQVSNRLAGIGDDLWAGARAELATGLQAGEPIEGLAARLERFFDWDAPTASARLRLADALAERDIAALHARRLAGAAGRLEEAEAVTARARLAAARSSVARARTAVEEAGRPYQVRARLIARTECLPGWARVDGAHALAVYRRFYSGQWVQIRTEAGREFAGTPNHPMLTDRGWVPLGQLTQADHLICYRPGVQQSGSAGDQDVQAPPASLSQLHDAAGRVGVAAWERGGEPDFHGDGRDGYVDVATPDCPLTVGVDPTVDQGRMQDLLSPSDAEAVALACQRAPLLFGSEVAEGMTLCRGPQAAPGLDDAADHSARLDAEVAADAAQALPAVVALADRFGVEGEEPRVVARAVLGVGGLLVAADLDTGPAECGGDRRRVPSEPLTDPAAADALRVELDHLAELVVTERWSGHVYNLTTKQGYFACEGFITGNTTGAYNAGQVAGAQVRAEITGAQLEKAWISTLDARTRPEHADADGQQVPLDQPFSVGDELLMHPGDTAGSAAACANCRCSTAIVNAGEMLPSLDRQMAGGPP